MKENNNGRWKKLESPDFVPIINWDSVSEIEGKIINKKLVKVGNRDVELLTLETDEGFVGR